MADMRTALTLTVVFLVLLFVQERAHGQGTSEQLPDPISVSEAARYYNHLQLSEQQRRAAERLFGEYRERFVQLREGTLGRALELEITDFGNRLPGLMVQIADIDETFFHDVEAILTDDQLAMLDDVRLMRDRARYQSLREFRLHSCYSFVDLREAMRHVELTAEQQERIAPVMRAHEQQMAGMLATFFRHSASFQSGNRDAADSLIEHGKRIRAMSLRALHQLEAMLEPRQADELRWRFTLQGYIRTRFAARLGVEAQYAAALELPDITPAQREAVEAAWQTLRHRRLAIHRKAIEILDAHGRINTGWEDTDAVNGMRTELGQQVSEMNTQAIAHLHGMFDEETVKQLDAVPSGTAVGGEHHYGTGINGIVISYVRLTPARPNPVVTAPSDDPFMPAPINESDVQFFAELLALEPGMTSLLNELHHSYTQRFKDAVQPMVDEALQLKTGSVGFGPGDELDDEAREEAAQAFEQVTRRFQIRRRVIDAITHLDASWFRDILAVLPAETADALAIERARVGRERQLYEGGAPMGFGNWPNRASAVNLSRMVLDHVGPDVRAELNERLLEYDRAYLHAVRERFEALWERQVMGESGTALVQLGETTWEQHYQDYLNIQRKVRDKHRAVAVINQEHLAKLLELLNDESARQLQHAFNLAAYPQVFDDPRNVIAPLAVAFELDGLTGDQRSELGEIAAEYRPEYYRLTQALIELTAEYYGDVPANLTLGDIEQQQIRERFNNENERLRFERDEVNRRATQRLRFALSAEQIRRIGGLTEPDESPTGGS